MRKLAIVGIVCVLLVVSAGAVLTLRASQTQGATTTASTNSGGGPGLFPFLGRGGGNNGGSSSNTANQTTVISTGDITTSVSATGHVVTDQQTSLSFAQSGIVKSIAGQVGDKVKAGQVLATLDDTAEQASIARAQDSVTAAQAALDKLLQPVTQADIDAAQASVTSAQASYQSAATSGTSAAALNTYQLQVQKAQAAASAADYARAGAGGQYSTTDPNYQKAVANVSAAQIAASQAQLNLEQAQHSGTNLDQSTANIALAEAKLAQVEAGPSQPTLDAAQMQVEVAKVQLTQAQHAEAAMQLVAPFDGEVSTINVKAGEQSSGTAFVLTNTSALYVDLNIDEADIGQVSVGLPVNLTVDALPNASLTGKVIRITPIADTSSTSVITYTTRVALDKPEAALKPGMTVSADFTITNAKNVTRVSSSYLKVNSTYNQTTVNLINANGTTTAVPVTIGVQGTDYSEVISGLRAGDRLALNAITTPTVRSAQG